MHKLKIFGIIVCFILAGCAGAAPKPETVEQPAMGEKTETVEKVETAQTPQTPQIPQTPPSTAPDAYNGRSLPYGLSYGMNKKQVTDILTKVTGGAPKAKDNILMWDGVATKKPLILMFLTAVFENEKLAILNLANHGKKNAETYKQMESGFNSKYNELKSKFTVKDTRKTESLQAALFETKENHFLILSLRADDKNDLYIMQLTHVEKLRQ